MRPTPFMESRAIRGDFLVDLTGFELRLLGHAFVDMCGNFVGEPGGQGFDLRIPG
jgi:hypothetical protein